mmetsp:Transcript_111335/g.359281  ORF Transcript_111335/g.359281 Transcript_111335/m.359281 type:complete len:283 (-) Transcript_111335:216-1064(-)
MRLSKGLSELCFARSNELVEGHLLAGRLVYASSVTPWVVPWFSPRRTCCPKCCRTSTRVARGRPRARSCLACARWRPRIHDTATDPKEFCVLPGGEHDLYGFRGHLLGKVSAFLTDALHRRRWRRSESRGGMHMDELAAQLAHVARDPLVASLSCVAPEASAAASVAPSLTSAQYSTPADYEYLYYSGEVVRLCGLRADHLNGLSAKVVSYEASSRRCGVEVLATKRRIAVKMTNLRQWVYDADFPDVCPVCHEMLNFCAVPPCACACVWPPPLVAMESSDT